MIHRLTRGEIPAKPHTAFYHDETLTFEHCFTRQGFDGVYSILYHRKAPHYILNQSEMGPHPGLSQLEPHSKPSRAHFVTRHLVQGGTPFLGRQRLMGNSQLNIWFAKADQADPTLVCNADGDEMVYVYKGRGEVQTPFGVLNVEAEDYVYLPRSVIHRWVPSEPMELLIMEGLQWIDVPEQFRHPQGQLKMDAPYTHRDFKEPAWHPELYNFAELPEELILKREGQLYRQHYKYHPFDIVGWDGQLWPYAFPIRAYQPKTGLVHLPPTIHTTFVGAGFVICSFVPRLVDFHPQAIPCPYPHSSVQCDEFLFYIEGNFTSRKGIGSGSVSLHPMGLPHGPHPGKYEESMGTQSTDELAVMVDTFEALYPSAFARAVEDPDYQYSWIKS